MLPNMHKFTETKTAITKSSFLFKAHSPFLENLFHPLATKYKIALKTLIKYRGEKLRKRLNINDLARVIECASSSKHYEFDDSLYASILKGVLTLKSINLLQEGNLESRITEAVSKIWEFKPDDVSFFDYFSLCLSLTGLAFAEKLEKRISSEHKEKWFKAGEKLYNILIELNYKKTAYVIGSLLVDMMPEGSKVKDYIQKRRKKMLEIEQEVKERLRSLEEKGINVHIITGRVKSPYSTLKKFIRKRLTPHDDINKVVTDLLGVRVVFEGNMNKCVIETIKELSEDFQLFAIKDYFNGKKEGNKEAWLKRLGRNGLRMALDGFILNEKKASGYKAIHLIFKKDNIYFEVQLRTLKDHNSAEWGNAEHARYKEGTILLKSAIERLKSAYLIGSKEVFIEVNGFSFPLMVWGELDRRLLTKEVAEKTNGVIISNSEFVATQINKIISDERINGKPVKIILQGSPIRESGGKTILKVHEVSVGFKKV